MASLSGVFNFQQFAVGAGNTATVLAGGRVYTYEAGTTTHKVAYTNASETVPQTYVNDGEGGLYIALNSRGEMPAPLFLALGVYDITLKTSAGVLVWTRQAIPLDYSDAEGTRVETVTATDGQTVVTVPFAYTRGNDSLRVFVNGIQYIGYGNDYTETTTTSITVTRPLKAGAEVTFISGSGVNPSSVTGTVSDTALAASTGSALVGHIASGTGAVARTVQSKLRDIVSAEDYTGYDKTGATNCVAAILAAAEAIGVGGIVYTPGKALIDTALTVPAGVTLKGPFDQVASFGSNQDASTYNSMAALIVNSSVSIKLSSGACIDGCFIYRKGMTFPAANTSAFAGTAIIADGTNFLDGDDVSVKNSLIIGFNQAIYTNLCQRVKLTDVYFDCNSGIHIEGSYDVSYLTRCHGWPFSTIKTYAVAGGINGGNAAEVLLQRSGTAFKFSNVGDWTKVTDCFSYAYYRGFHILNCNSMTLLSCSPDNTPKDATPVTNILLNGDFAGGTTSWTGFGASGKSVSGGKAVFAATPAANGITQPLSLPAGKYYEVTFTVSGYSAGNVYPFFSGGTTRTGTARTANGTYTERLLVNSGNTTFGLESSSTASLSIDDITVTGPYDFALPLLGYPGAIGVWVDGTSYDTRLIGCQTAAQGTAGYYFSTSALHPSRMIGCDAWAPIERCVLVQSGEVSITGGTLRNAPDGIVITSSVSRVWVDKVRFTALTGYPFKTTVATSLLEIGRDNDYGDFPAGSALVIGTVTTPTLASAATLNLPATGDEFIITGTTNFGTLVGGHKDRRVTLFFAGVLTVFNGTGTTNNIRLSGGAANFTTTAGATLTLAHNGTQWYEVSRSA